MSATNQHSSKWYPRLVSNYVQSFGRIGHTKGHDSNIFERNVLRGAVFFLLPGGVSVCGGQSPKICLTLTNRHPHSLLPSVVIMQWVGIITLWKMTTQCCWNGSNLLYNVFSNSNGLKFVGKISWTIITFIWSVKCERVFDVSTRIVVFDFSSLVSYEFRCYIHTRYILKLYNQVRTFWQAFRLS